MRCCRCRLFVLPKLAEVIARRAARACARRGYGHI
nr:MAG TPA: Sep15/SelM redox domain [Caudoviricetes sp.]